MAKKLAVVILGFSWMLAVPLHADTVNALDPFNSGPVPTSPFSLVNLGSSGSPENQLVSTATVGPTGGETISFSGGASQAGSSYVDGVYVGSISDVATSPALNSTTYYLVAQPNTSSSSGVTIAFSTPQTSFNLLWGTIDTGENGTSNYLTFYNGSTEVAQVTGSNVAAALSGDASFEAGTTSAYVEISGLPSFTSVVASDPGSSSAFEFIPGVDAVTSTPEPGTLGMLAIGLAGLAGVVVLGSLRRHTASC